MSPIRVRLRPSRKKRRWSSNRFTTPGLGPNHNTEFLCGLFAQWLAFGSARLNLVPGIPEKTIHVYDQKANDLFRRTMAAAKGKMFVV